MTELPDRLNRRLRPDDVAELIEMLTFLSDWLAHDPELLAASLRRFVGGNGYNLAELRADIDLFGLRLGDDGTRLFEPDQDSGRGAP